MIYEEWRDIEGYEGIYQVSNMGRVKSLNRINPQNKHQEEKIMKNYLGRRGYYTIKLMREGKAKVVLVHRLVADAFIPNPDELPCINHIDEDKRNNSVTNLEWCSYKYNDNYGSRNKKIAIARGCPVVSIDGNGTRQWYQSMSDAARALNCDGAGNISQALSGKTKTAYGYKWERATKEKHEMVGEKP